MERADKSFKITMMTTFKKTEEEMGNFITDLESISKE